MRDPAAAKPTKLIIGLGNPGSRYENTYHNVGHLAIDYFASHRADLELPITRYSLLKSDAFMNESGSFVRSALGKRGLKPDALLLVHDDADIAFGSYKISFGRGSAGHRGVASVIAALQTKNFHRLRIGVRRTGNMQKAGTFVLGAINKKSRAVLEGVLAAAAGAVQTLLER